MIANQDQVDYFKRIAKNQFSLMVIDQFGEESMQDVLKLTEGITEIYKFLDYNSFERVLICKRVGDVDVLNHYDNNLKVVVGDYNSFATKSGNSIIVEIHQNNSFSIIMDQDVKVEDIKKKGIIYSYTRGNDLEVIYANDGTSTLEPIPGADTYFSIQTFKNLDTALEQYAIKRARFSVCPYLESAWLDENRIFFKPRPESYMRDSLTDFLKITFREEVRPEQIVDTSHPVDIKVTWQSVNRIALIEVKWLGKSIDKLGQNFSSNYTESRAREGAQQLNDYLDSNKLQAPDRNSKGYLVVFDARRWQTNKTTISINDSNGNYYRNREIAYNPKFEETRSDFAKPVRFFLEPKVTIHG